MSESLLRLSGIAAEGYHGADPGEKLESQPFVVDLAVTVEVDGRAIEDTADYSALIATAREVVERESHDLLETLAESVARAVFGFQNVVAVVAVVHKPRAAELLGVDDVSAEAFVR
ncbi:MAG: dihydroneopterin aldolase [Actinomycetota bacterium]